MVTSKWQEFLAAALAPNVSTTNKRSWCDLKYLLKPHEEWQNSVCDDAADGDDVQVRASSNEKVSPSKEIFFVMLLPWLRRLSKRSLKPHTELNSDDDCLHCLQHEQLIGLRLDQFSISLARHEHELRLPHLNLNMQLHKTLSTGTREKLGSNLFCLSKSLSFLFTITVNIWLCIVTEKEVGRVKSFQFKLKSYTTLKDRIS